MNMNRLWSNYKAFLRYLLSYILILLIPLVIMSFLIYKNIIKTLENEVVNNNIIMLSQVRDTLDMKLRELQALSVRLSSNPKLLPYILSSSPYNRYEAIQELKNYKSTNALIYELCLYIKGRDTIYSSSSTYTVSSFIDWSYRYKNWNHNSFYNDINLNEEVRVLPVSDVYISSDSNKSRIITFLYPVPPVDNYPYATAIVLVKENTVTNMIKDILKDYGGATIILDNNQKVITSYGNNIPDIDSSALDYKHNSGSEILELNNNEFFVSYVKSNFVDWSYITVVPKDTLLEKVTYVKKITLNIIYFILVIGALEIAMMMKYNYRPIKKLRRHLENLVGSWLNKETANEEVTGDDFEVINKVMDDIALTNIALSKKIISQKKFLKDQVLVMLLRGQVLDRQEFENLTGENELVMNKPYFIVAVLCIENNSRSPEIKNKIRNEISKYNMDGIMAYCVELIDIDYLAIICNVDTGMVNVRHNMEAIKEILEKQYHITISIGVGKTYDGFLEISKSYIEAYSALDYRMLKGKGQIIFFDDINPAADSIFRYPTAELKQLQVYLKQGEEGQVDKELSAIINIITSENIPLYVARCYCFDIINTIIKVMHELNIGFDSLPNDRPDLTNLTQFETIEQLRDMIYRLCMSVCSYIKKSRESSNFDLKDKLLKYVHENYKNPGFSMKYVADEFKLSQSYLSRYFKDQTGYTIMEYLTMLRINDIKKELETTDKAIKEIILAAGYIDIASFNRKFRNLEGMTPGQYRAICKEKTS